MRKAFNNDIDHKVGTLHNVIQEHSEKLTQKLANTLESLAGSPVNFSNNGSNISPFKNFAVNLKHMSGDEPTSSQTNL